MAHAKVVGVAGAEANLISKFKVGGKSLGLFYLKAAVCFFGVIASDFRNRERM